MDEYPIDFLRRAQRVDNFTRMVEQVADEKKVFAIVGDDGKPLAIVIDPESLAELRAAYVMQEVRNGIR